METITTDKAKQLINDSGGRIFSAVFIKKDNTHHTRRKSTTLSQYTT